MKKKYLISTNYEINNLNDFEKNSALHFSDASKVFDYKKLDKNPWVLKNNSNSRKSKKYCKILTNKVFDQLYWHIIQDKKLIISKKAYSIILVPFLNNFIETIYEKFTQYNKIVLKNKKLTLITLNRKNFIHFKNFAEFISFSQNDFFNLQLISEIIYFNKYSNNKEIIGNGKLKIFLKKTKNYFLNQFNQTPHINHSNIYEKKKINNYVATYNIDFRHGIFMKEFNKYKIPSRKNLKKNFFEKFDLVEVKKSDILRKKVFKKLKSNLKIENFIFKMVTKYLPSLYFESIPLNLQNVENKMKDVPKFLISNAHGWWTDDKFKFYAAICIKNKTKYFDIQHNGTYFIIDNNPHFTISKYFRNYFLGWGSACENEKNSFKLPVLYNVNNQTNTIKNNYSKKTNKIIFMGASVKRYFGGYFQSYLNGGNSFLYYYSQYKFLISLSDKIKKKLILRLRHNERDPRGYISYLKNNLKDLKFEDIKATAASRLAKKDIKIIVVDHCSTPWLEALQANKPLILFWSKSENLINKKYLPLIDILKKYKIYFECPIAAAKRLEEISKKNIKWWYKDKNIQRLRKKILDLFFYYDKKPVKLWNEKIKDIYYEKF